MGQGDASALGSDTGSFLLGPPLMAGDNSVTAMGQCPLMRNIAAMGLCPLRGEDTGSLPQGCVLSWWMSWQWGCITQGGMLLPWWLCFLTGEDTGSLP